MVEYEETIYKVQWQPIISIKFDLWKKSFITVTRDLEKSLHHVKIAPVPMQ